jgi:spermidine dehydrogenase
MTGRASEPGYPPALTGMRGSTDAAYAAGHAIRDGARFDVRDLPVEEEADLVVVGAGISGLSAAWFFRRARPDASVLLLDNHDDFGGHARRNEFRVDGRLLIGYGGSESLQSPKTLYGQIPMELLTSLGVDLDRLQAGFDETLYPSLGLSRGVFFPREAFGVDRLVTGDPMRMVDDDIPPDRMNERPIQAFLSDVPVSTDSRRQLLELFTSERHPFREESDRPLRRSLARMSYRTFLRRYWGLSDEAADTFQGRSHDFYAEGIDAISALAAMETGYPGFASLRLDPDPEATAEMDDPYTFHFPDGNATIARLLVRSLMPQVAEGDGMEDVLTAAFDYAALDVPGCPVRLRLRSTAVDVRNADGGVDVGYLRNGELHRVHTKSCVLAGYAMMVPAIMPELADPQAAALSGNVKAPIVYVNVAVRNWHPWVRVGVHEVTNPMGFFSRLKLDYPVSLGNYRCARTSDEPTVLHLVHVPSVRSDDLTVRERFRRGRDLLYDLTLADFDERVRDELTRMLAAGGFDAARDIAAITVNRWGHGYAYGGDPVFDPDDDATRPWEIARERVGRVAFANADSAWEAFAHVAIEQGHRAASELLAQR